MDGRSELINFDILYNKIIFTYMLKKSQVASYAGISFDISVPDISTYDFMELQAVITIPATYLLTLITFMKGESRLSELDSLVYFNSEIDLKETKQNGSSRKAI
ncbi:MAG: hypothetical protein JXJ04_01420 [Spirochaetales bacterium]|nr:hypothetical protein [Spirochaetales bacterium]